MLNVNENFLIGHWIEDVNIQDKDEYAEMIIGEDGTLIYINNLKNEIHKFILTYQIEGDTLITDQPSSPEIVRSKYLITPDHKLIITYGSISTCFRKK